MVEKNPSLSFCKQCPSGPNNPDQHLREDQNYQAHLNYDKEEEVDEGGKEFFNVSSPEVASLKHEVQLINLERGFYFDELEKNSLINIVVISERSTCLGPMVATMLRAFLEENIYMASKPLQVTIDFTNINADQAEKPMCPIAVQSFLKPSWISKNITGTFSIESIFWYDYFIFPSHKDYKAFTHKLKTKYEETADEQLSKRLQQLLKVNIIPDLMANSIFKIISQANLDPHENYVSPTTRNHRQTLCELSPYLFDILESMDISARE